MRHLRLVVVIAAAGTFAIEACVGDSTVVTDGGSDATTTDVTPDVVSDAGNDAQTSGPINGTVYAIDGTVLAGAKVEANGQVATTDATGAFTLPDPGPTYTITFLYSESGVPQPIAFVYQGMTRRDPVLMMPIRVFQNPMTVSGTVPNALNTIPNALGARLVFAPKKIVGNNGAYGTIVTDGGFSTTIMNFPGKSQTGTLYFYERTFNDAGNGTGYPVIASLNNVGFANGTTAVETFDASSSPSTGNVGWAVTGPTAGSWTIEKTALRAIFGGTTPVQLDQVGPGVSAFTFLAPNIGQLVLDSTATSSTNATSTAWNTGITVNSSGISLTLPNPPVVASPASNTTVPIATTPFVYNSVQGVAYATLECFDAGSDGGPSSVNYLAHVITAATSVIAPVDAALAVAATHSGSSCVFIVGGLALYTTVDAAAGPGGYANAFSAEYATVNGAFGLSAPQTVTAQ